MKHRLVLAIGIIAAGAGLALASCSGGPAVTPGSSDPASAGARAAATPLDTFYVVNYNGNDVAQYAFYPKSKPPFKSIAPNYKLPSGCTGPDAIAIAVKLKMAFVACFSGEIVPLKFTATYALAAAKIKPVPVPSPLFLIAPATGAANVLYAGLYSIGGSTQSGGVAALSYGKTSLKAIKTYSAGYYPGAMALYTGGAKSTLYVASPFELAGCAASTGGAIDVFTQSSNGQLTPQSPIDVCSYISNLALVGKNLYWAGPKVLGGYNVATGKPLALAAAPWAADGSGPTYYPYAMSAMVRQTLAPGGLTAHADEFGGDFIVGGGNGRIDVLDAKGRPIVSWTGVSQSHGSHCQDFGDGITIGKEVYRAVCWQLINDQIVVYGLTKAHGRPIDLGKLDPGDFPIAQQMIPWSSW